MRDRKNKIFDMLIADGYEPAAINAETATFGKKAPHGGYYRVLVLSGYPKTNDRVTSMFLDGPEDGKSAWLATTIDNSGYKHENVPFDKFMEIVTGAVERIPTRLHNYLTEKALEDLE